MNVRFGPVTGLIEPGIGWIRVFGIGLHWKDSRRHSRTFSERYGYTRSLAVGPWLIRGLGRAT